MAGALSREMRALPYRFNEPLVSSRRGQVLRQLYPQYSGSNVWAEFAGQFLAAASRDHERGLGSPRRPPGGPGWAVRACADPYP